MAKKRSRRVTTKNKRPSPSAQVGMIGLGVMGQNLALNLADHRYTVVVYDREPQVMRRFVAESAQELDSTDGGSDRLVGCRSLKDFVTSIQKPRKIMLMIKAGAPVDSVIGQLQPLISRGDVIIDGGNSRWTDTIRREQELAKRGIHFVGSGVSGGETGARFGPSLMPGGSRAAWKLIGPMWKAIAAKVDRKTGKPIEGAAPGKPTRGGVPCAAYIGPDGAGHYVKMVHNGIEYADMQLITEAYFLLTQLLGYEPDRLAKVFERWNRGPLDSYLIEITADILRQRDPKKPKRFLVDAVVDTAGQKGTGKWTSTSALDMGVPSPTIAEAVFARYISAIRTERLAASRSLRGPRYRFKGSERSLVKAVHDALYCSKVCCYAQGFALMSAAQDEYGWKLDKASIARIWRGGCIIRAQFLNKITEAYSRKPSLANLLLDPYFRRQIASGQAGWRKVAQVTAESGIPCPAFMSALAYYDSYRAPRLPANLLQAQRDYFGAHTYQRLDAPASQWFHLDWSDPDRPQLKV